MDQKIPFGTCKLVFGCKHIHTSTYEDDPKDLVDWDFRTIDGKKTEVLIVESYVRENPIEVEIREREASKSSQSGKSTINYSSRGLISIKSSVSESSSEETPVASTE